MMIRTKNNIRKEAGSLYNIGNYPVSIGVPSVMIGGSALKYRSDQKKSKPNYAGSKIASLKILWTSTSN